MVFSYERQQFLPHLAAQVPGRGGIDRAHQGAQLDGSLAGIGGCPFAPGAAGNVPTEDLLYMFNRMGFDTGVDLAAAIEAAQFIGGVLGRKTPGMVSRAPRWPS